MTTARLLTAALAALAGLGSAPTIAQTALGLTFNGKEIVPVGQVESFSYHPSAGQVAITTFFGDIRCSPGDQGGTGNIMTSNIDRFERGPDLDEEVEASYKIFSGGLVEYDPGNGMIYIKTSGNGLSDCQHKFPVVETNPETGEFDKDIFWISDFSGPVDITSDSTGTLEVGDERQVRITVSNDSGLLVAKGFALDLDSSSLPQNVSVGVSVDGCVPADVPAEVTTGTESGIFRLDIPVLWPGEGCDILVSYDLTNAEPGKTIETQLVDPKETENRVGAPLNLGLAGVSLVNTTTAP